MKDGLRFTKKSMAALQTGTEGFLTDMFFKSYGACKHAKRVTLMDYDIRLWKFMTNRASYYDPPYRPPSRIYGRKRKQTRVLNKTKPQTTSNTILPIARTSERSKLTVITSKPVQRPKRSTRRKNRPTKSQSSSQKNTGYELPVTRSKTTINK